MLENHIIKQVNELVAGLSREEIIWLNGYLSGLVSGNGNHALEATAATTVKKITLTYGTETGNSKKLAAAFAATAKKKGIQAKLVSLDQYKLTDLEKENYFFSIISTQGDGEPPVTAKKFFDHIHSTNDRLTNLKYSVLALGDSAYPLFCKAGEDVDAQFGRLGATPIVPLVKVDTDLGDEATEWFDAIIQTISDAGPAFEPIKSPVTNKKGKQLYKGRITEHINLNGRSSDKETWHIEISSAGVNYEPGDAMGIVPWNTAKTVEKILNLSEVDAETLLDYKGESLAIETLLRQKLAVAHLPERVVAHYRKITGHDLPETRMDLTDLLRIYPVNNKEQFLEFVQFLEPITPRLYSIASSLLAHEDEVHLTVSKHQFCVGDQSKTGLCSNYFASLKPGDEISFYIHKNHLFKLPAGNKDIIMIGPGTGVAPFRSFVAEREMRGDEGRNWLFFGDRNFENDFLYQTEWQNWMATGTLTKMNVAFSRDQAEKLYVQHKLKQHATDVYEWISNGACVFVCGAKDPMSTDVENTLLQIIQGGKNTSSEDAAAYLTKLKEEGRFVLDVY